MEVEAPDRAAPNLNGGRFDGQSSRTIYEDDPYPLSKPKHVEQLAAVEHSPIVPSIDRMTDHQARSKMDKRIRRAGPSEPVCPTEAHNAQRLSDGGGKSMNLPPNGYLQGGPTQFPASLRLIHVKTLDDDVDVCWYGWHHHFTATGRTREIDGLLLAEFQWSYRTAVAE
ncbi:DUF5988 family protein [Kitasatospora purpeofusca]|uniref:DUF5988 family protein n=1 Tax=Kitasatospora purpeofusca TaxID=67352 RepID=UPI0036CA82D1